jgi:hypothetical protein
MQMLFTLRRHFPDIFMQVPADRRNESCYWFPSPSRPRFDVDALSFAISLPVNLMQYTWVIYNLDWIILQNDSAEPFVTSDNPFSMSYSGSPRVEHTKS